MLGAMAQTPVETVPSVCPHDCTSTCALEVERLDLHTIGRVRGSHRNTYTRGVICEKVGRYAERVHHPDRLLHPLRRVGPKGSGRFERIAWEDALDLVAENFTRQAARLGLETVWPYYYAGTMGLVQRDGINRLTHAMGYSRYFSTICVTLADTGWAAGVGAKRGVDLREIGEHSDLVVIWGGNPVNTQVNVMSHAMQAKRRGATFVVVDPYRTDTAAKADLHLAPRPGTDGALACAIMHVLFAEGLADWDYLRAYTDCPDELAAHVATRTPEWAAAITGLSVDQIVDFARLYGRTKKSFIRCHHGFSRSRNGAVNMHAVTCLPAITGAWRHKGGGAVYGQTALYPLDRTLIEGRDLVDKSIRALDQSRLGQILTGDREALQGGPPVTAMLVQNTNPAMVCPELNLVHRGTRPRGSLPLRARAVPDRDRGLRRRGPARDDVRRARRLLHRERAHLLPGHQEGDRAAGRVPREPLGDLRAGQAPRRDAPGLPDDARGRSWTRRCASPACGTRRPTGAAAARTSRPRSRPRTSSTASPRRTGASTSSPTGRASAGAGRRCPRSRITSR